MEPEVLKIETPAKVFYMVGEVQNSITILRFQVGEHVITYTFTPSELNEFICTLKRLQQQQWSENGRRTER